MSPARLPYVAGAVLDGARHVLHRGVAPAPVGPFHQAWFRGAASDCTFNVLLIAALALKRAGSSNVWASSTPALHPATGSRNILQRLQQPAWLRYLELSTLGEAQAEGDFSCAGSAGGATGRLRPAHLSGQRRQPLARFAEGWLDENQLRQRDLQVCRTAAEWRIPLVALTGAGHQRDDLGRLTPVLRLHDLLLQVCAEVFAGWRL